VVAFADPTELEQYLGESFDITEEDRAGVMLDMASAMIRAYTGQQITAGTSTESFEDAWVRPIQLRNFPVNSITSVELDGVVESPSGYSFTSSGLVYRKPSYMTWGYYTTVEVTYEHGYDVVPDDVKAVCLSIAARMMSQATTTARTMGSGGQVTSEQVGSYRVTFADPGEASSRLGSGGMTDDERAILAPYTSFVAA